MDYPRSAPWRPGDTYTTHSITYMVGTRLVGAEPKRSQRDGWPARNLIVVAECLDVVVQQINLQQLGVSPVVGPVPKAFRSVRLYAGTTRPPLRGVVVAVVVEQGRQKGATGQKSASCMRADCKKVRRVRKPTENNVDGATTDGTSTTATIATTTNINKLSGF
jgi:hypothetical protein